MLAIDFVKLLGSFKLFGEHKNNQANVTRFINEERANKNFAYHAAFKFTNWIKFFWLWNIYSC